jgi:malonate-semialdehyde dehydrogenase (acetylating)/methylmalonate-semialdehyde dehydrogenase
MSSRHPYLATHLSPKGELSVQDCPHWINDTLFSEKGTSSPSLIHSPYTGALMARLHAADRALVDHAVQEAARAFTGWGQTTFKERAQVLFRFREELLKDQDELAATISFESGKTVPEAKAGLFKGIEVLEFALSLQNLDAGGKMEVSSGVFCEYRRIPAGVVAGITPFNFPAMVPMWMIPIALALGNCFVWKPSDKTPMTSLKIAAILKRCGLPKGVFTVLQGGRETVEAILDHPGIAAVGFVGSTPIAKEVYRRGSANLKRVLALGGAKNHILLMPDADPEMAALGIRDSFTGCAGQRCMAASVLVAVGGNEALLRSVIEKSAELTPGEQMGAIITKAQVDFLRQAVQRAEEAGAKVALDGRRFTATGEYAGGNWLAPTILDQVKPGAEAATQELFGPILSIVRAGSLEEALEIECSGVYGNATSVFTSSGAVAEEVARRATSGMIGINIGVPVPREPFSFGGHYESKFGTGDITGIHSLNFWSQLKKITTKWTLPKNGNWMS